MADQKNQYVDLTVLLILLLKVLIVVLTLQLSCSLYDVQVKILVL